MIHSGIAETLDLLGMTSYLGGDLIGGTAYYQQAIALFDELGNREGLISSLATLTMRASTYHTDTLIAVASLAEVLPDAERAVKLAREIATVTTTQACPHSGRWRHAPY